jgi:hypothetical protein
MIRLNIALLGDDADVVDDNLQTDAVVQDGESNEPEVNSDDLEPEDRPRPAVGELSVDKVFQQSKAIDEVNEVNKAKDE